MTDMSKSALEDLIFESVIDLNQDRILQRIRPNWISTPDYFRKGKLERNIELPLWERIRAILHRPECHPRLRRGLNKVISELQLLKVKPCEHGLFRLLNSIIRACTSISYRDCHRWLQQLRHLLESECDKSLRDLRTNSLLVQLSRPLKRFRRTGPTS